MSRSQWPIMWPPRPTSNCADLNPPVSLNRYLYSDAADASIARIDATRKIPLNQTSFGVKGNRTDMKLNFKTERVLGVVAHPDDAELLCAGTLARAKRDGAAIGICVLCKGDKGQPSEKVANLTATRRKEMAASAGFPRAPLLLRGNCVRPL